MKRRPVAMPPTKAHGRLQQERKKVEALCRWFEREARDLPWRKARHRNGYGALVAESMLQQTQVSRVVDAYSEFIRRFPTIKSLAAADEQNVLAKWQGLGYYRRAKNLHAAAKMIVGQFNGKVPRTVEQLLALPGVGRYTAGAIASIVYGDAAPIVDGNVQRVLMRLHGRRGNHSGAATLKWTWSKANELVTIAKRPGVMNEALMELGAMICTPRQPRCGDCPVSKWCAARRSNLQHHIPRAARRTTPRLVHHHAVVVTCAGKLLVEQRAKTTKGRMWESMWQVPTIESDCRLSETEIKRALPQRINDLVELGSFDHHTSHRHIQFHVYRSSTRARKGTWYAPHRLSQLPMSNAQKRIVKLSIGSGAAAQAASG